MRPRPSTVIPIVLVALVGIGATVLAREPKAPIFVALEAIQSTLDTLLTIATSNTRITPNVLAFTPDVAVCTATNVSAVARSVTIHIVNGTNGAEIVQRPVDMAPGTSAATFAVPAATPGIGLDAYCRITVVNGTKADVRGVLALVTPTPAANLEKVALAAE